MLTARARTFLGVAFIGIAVFIACLYFYFYRLPVSISRLSRLQHGMTTNEVAAILGRPLDIQYMPPAKGETNELVLEKCLMWEYGSVTHFWVVDVFFDQDGRYTSYWRD